MAGYQSFSLDAVEKAQSSSAAAYRECWAEVGGLGTVSAPRD